MSVIQTFVIGRPWSGRASKSVLDWTSVPGCWFSSVARLVRSSSGLNRSYSAAGGAVGSEDPLGTTPVERPSIPYFSMSDSCRWF